MHEGGGEGGCKFSTHGSAVFLKVVSSVELEKVVFQYVCHHLF